MPHTVVAGGGRAGQALRTYECFDFRGGLDVVTSPIVLAMANTGGAKNRLVEATNVVYNIDGSISKRWGTQLLTTPAGLNGLILGGVYYRKSDGTALTVVGTQGGVLCKIVGTSLSALASLSPNVSKRYSFAVYQDRLYIANSQDPLYQYDGTTTGPTLGSSPAKPTQVVAHANRLFATDYDVRSRLSWCKLNNPSDWSGVDDAGFMLVNPDDGGIIKGLIPSIQELSVLKSYRPYRLQGIGPVTGYTLANSMTPAAGSIGCTNMTAATFAGNDVWYMSQMGVHRLSATDQFGDILYGLVSDAVEPFFRQDHAYMPYGVDYSPYIGMSYQSYEHFYNSFMACHDQGNNLLFFGQVGGYPRGQQTATTNAMDRFLIYDLRLKNWAVWQTHVDDGSGNTDYPGEFSSMWPSEHALSLGSTPELCLGAYFRSNNTTAVVSMRRGLTNDETAAGTVPVRTYATHITDLGATTVRKCPRHIFLYFAPVTASTTITLEITYDLRPTPDVTTSFDIYDPAVTGPRVVKRIDLGTHLCQIMTVRISNARLSETFRWLGYEVMWSMRREIMRG
jgi:hypothetical protein